MQSSTDIRKGGNTWDGESARCNVGATGLRTRRENRTKSSKENWGTLFQIMGQQGQRLSVFRKQGSVSVRKKGSICKY